MSRWGIVARLATRPCRRCRGRPRPRAGGWPRASSLARMSPRVTSWLAGVRDLDADGLPARDGGQDADVGRGHGVGDVLVEARDPGHLHAGAELELVAGDRSGRRSCRPAGSRRRGWPGPARGCAVSSTDAVSTVCGPSGRAAWPAAASTSAGRPDRARSRAARAGSASGRPGRRARRLRTAPDGAGASASRRRRRPGRRGRAWRVGAAVGMASAVVVPSAVGPSPVGRSMASRRPERRADGERPRQDPGRGTGAGRGGTVRDGWVEGAR